MKSITVSVFNFILSALLLTAFATASLGQTLVKSTVKNPVNVVSAPNASVTPVVFDGQNINCADLNALHVNGSGDIRFSHIITDNEMKLNFADPNGTYPYTTGNGRIVIGPQDATKTFTVTSSSNPAIVQSWSSTWQVTAINVKVGNTSYVYPYKPFAMSDTNLNTGDQRGISHITICYNDTSVNPTAADGSISGRVVDTNGFGVSKAQIVLIDGETGQARIALTSPFGYYTFDGIEVGRLYVLNVSHKRYNFAEAQRVVSLTDSIADIDFVANSMY